MVAVQPSYADPERRVLPFVENERALETLANAVLARPTEPKPISYTAIAEARTNVSLLETVSSARMKVSAGATIISIATKF